MKTTETTKTKKVTLATIEALLAGLNEAERASFEAHGYTHPPDVWHCNTGRKFHKLDCGTSGAFMVEVATGELYNIRSYGQADHNKKAKADIGNLFTVDPKELHGKRFNYLR